MKGMAFDCSGGPDEVKQLADAGIFTSVTAERYLRKEFPHVKHWMCWVMAAERRERALSAMAGDGLRHSGKIGSWNWERVPCSYATASFWGGDVMRPEVGFAWIGMLRVRGDKGEDFLIFSYLRPDLMTGKELMVSTGDTGMLRRFADDLDDHFTSLSRQSPNVHVHVINGMDMKIPMDEKERIYLPQQLVEDIDGQVMSFFRNGDLYKDLGVPYRRGFLFTGVPGTGKTMMIRRLARLCRGQFEVEVRYLLINAMVDSNDLRMFFSGGHRKRPVILILEDLESLMKETRISRSEFLACLDGIETTSGTLLIATANNPEVIDPALLHRPSRFDRVWRFPMPDKPLRHRYLRDSFPGTAEDTLQTIVSRSSNWTFAYLKELKVTSGVIAIQKGRARVCDETLMEGFAILRDQFNSAQKEYRFRETRKDGPIGFGGAGFSHDEEDAA